VPPLEAISAALTIEFSSHEMIGFAAQRRMELEVEGQTEGAYVEKSASSPASYRVFQRSGAGSRQENASK
jgi:hypothetical protein